MKQQDTTTPTEPNTGTVDAPPRKKTVTLEEGAAMLVDRIMADSTREKHIQDTVSCFREVQKVAIHEAAICLHLGGLPALSRLFEHHGIRAGIGEHPPKRTG
jgi:hypothetical protein